MADEDQNVMENQEGNTEFMYDEQQFAVPDEPETEFGNYETAFGEHETEYDNYETAFENNAPEFEEFETEFQNHETQFENNEHSPTHEQAMCVITDSGGMQSFLPIPKETWQRPVENNKATNAGNNIPSPTNRFPKQTITAKVPKWKVELAQKNRYAPKVPQWKIELSETKKEKSANVPRWKQELPKTKREEKVEPWKKEISERHHFIPGEYNAKYAEGVDKGSREAVQRTAFFEEGYSINEMQKLQPTPTTSEEKFRTPSAGSKPDQIFSSIPIGVALPPPSVIDLKLSDSSEIPPWKLELAKRNQSKKKTRCPKAVHCDDGDSRNEIPRRQPTPTEINTITADEKTDTPAAAGSNPNKIFSSITLGVALPPPSVIDLKLTDSSENPPWKLELAKRNQLKKGAHSPHHAVPAKETELGGERGTYKVPRLKPTPIEIKSIVCDHEYKIPRLKPTPIEIKNITQEEEKATTSVVTTPAPIVVTTPAPFESYPKQNNTVMFSKTKLETEKNRSPTKVPPWKTELTQRKRLKLTKMAPAWKIELSQRNKSKALGPSPESVSPDKAGTKFRQVRLRPTSAQYERKSADSGCSEFSQIRLRPTKRQPEQETGEWEEANDTHDIPMIQPSPKECSELCQVRLRPTNIQHDQNTADCEEENGANDLPIPEPIPEERPRFGKVKLRPTSTNPEQKTAQPCPKECSEICKIRLRPTYRQPVQKTAECQEGSGSHEIVIDLPVPNEIKRNKTEQEVGTVSKSPGQSSRVSPTKDGKLVIVPPAPFLPNQDNAFYHWNLELTQYKLQLAQKRKHKKGVHNRPSVDDERSGFDEGAFEQVHMDLQQYKISSDDVTDQCTEHKVKQIQSSIGSEYKDRLCKLMAELKTNLPKPASAFDDISDTEKKT